MLLNSKSRWGIVSQFFHWITALLIFASFITGLLWWLRHYTGVGVGVISNHKTVGLCILVLVIARILWRLVVSLPRSHHSLSKSQQVFIKISHRIIILLMLVMPISGWMMSTAAGYKTNIYVAKIAMPFVEKNKSLVVLTSDIHHYASWVLLMLVFIHIYMAFWHHFIRKDPVLLRMLPRVLSRTMGIKIQR